MTKREIMALVQHNKESKTYYIHHAGHGIHGTSLQGVAEQFKKIICQMPGCGNTRCKRGGRVAYLCPNHYDEACRNENAH